MKMVSYSAHAPRANATHLTPHTTLPAADCLQACLLLPAQPHPAQRGEAAEAYRLNGIAPLAADGELLLDLPDTLTTAAQDSAPLSQSAYFRRLAEMFATRGWGHFTHERAHPGVAVLQAADWVEADPEARTGRPSCFFTTGMLANILGQQVGGEIAVYEIECRSNGDTRCRFMIGAPETLLHLHENASEHTSVEALVATLDG